MKARRILILQLILQSLQLKYVIAFSNCSCGILRAGKSRTLFLADKHTTPFSKTFSNDSFSINRSFNAKHEAHTANTKNARFTS